MKIAAAQAILRRRKSLVPAAETSAHGASPQHLHRDLLAEIAETVQVLTLGLIVAGAALAALASVGLVIASVTLVVGDLLATPIPAPGADHVSESVRLMALAWGCLVVMFVLLGAGHTIAPRNNGG